MIAARRFHVERFCQGIKIAANRYIREAVKVIESWPPAALYVEPELMEQQIGAEVKKFFTVAGALKWMMAHSARQTSLEQNLSRAGGDADLKKMARAHATYARILSCLQPKMADVDGENIATRVDELVAWLNGDRSKSFLADEAGLTEQRLSKRVGKTEQIVKARMNARGLIKEREG
jgi:hypothetical protein